MVEPKSKPATVKLKSLNKKNQTVALTKVLKTRKKGQKKVTYSLKGDDRFTIDPNKGKITVPTGLGAGDYSMTLVVHADGGQNYYPTDVDIPITIKVK